MAVERALDLARGGVPHLDEPVASRAGHLHLLPLLVSPLTREAEPGHLQDAVGVALERAQAAVVAEAPQLDRLVAAAREDEPAARHGFVLALHDGRARRRELDRPDAPLVAPEDALDLAFLDRPYLDGPVLRGRREEMRRAVDVYGVDVFVVGLPRKERTRRFLGSRMGRPRHFPSLDRLVL